MLVGAAVVFCSTGGFPVIDDTFTLNSPSFPSTIAVWIVEIVSSSATSVLNFNTTSKIRLPQLKQKIDIQKILTTSIHFPKEFMFLYLGLKELGKRTVMISNQQWCWKGYAIDTFELLCQQSFQRTLSAKFKLLCPAKYYDDGNISLLTLQLSVQLQSNFECLQRPC